MVLFLDGEELVQLADLGQSNSGMQFRDPVVVADKRMKIGSPIDALMIMTMVSISVSLDIEVFAIGQYGSAFRTGDGLYKVEGEGTGLPDSSQVTALVLSACALAGIFQQDNVMFFTNGQEGIQVGHGATHMHGHDT